MLPAAWAVGDVTVTDWSASSAREPVLVVVTPGFAPDGFAPLARALEGRGHDVRLATVGCAAGSVADVSAGLAEAIEALPDDPIVVAHGVGAALALGAAPRVTVRRWVLLAPVLDVPPLAVLDHLAWLRLGPTLDLSGTHTWNGHDVTTLLLGDEPPPLGCVSAPVAAGVLDWVRRGDVDIPWDAVAAPVVVLVSLGDDVAGVEVVVPASRRLRDRTVVRLGRNRLDPGDYSHGRMLTDPVPIRAAARAAAW